MTGRKGGLFCFLLVQGALTESFRSLCNDRPFSTKVLVSHVCPPAELAGSQAAARTHRGTRVRRQELFQLSMSSLRTDSEDNREKVPRAGNRGTGRQDERGTRNKPNVSGNQGSGCISSTVWKFSALVSFHLILDSGITEVKQQ